MDIKRIKDEAVAASVNASNFTLDELTGNSIVFIGAKGTVFKAKCLTSYSDNLLSFEVILDEQSKPSSILGHFYKIVAVPCIGTYNIDVYIENVLKTSGTISVNKAATYAAKVFEYEFYEEISRFAAHGTYDFSVPSLNAGEDLFCDAVGGGGGGGGGNTSTTGGGGGSGGTGVLKTKIASDSYNSTGAIHCIVGQGGVSSNHGYSTVVGDIVTLAGGYAGKAGYNGGAGGVARNSSCGAGGSGGTGGSLSEYASASWGGNGKGENFGYGGAGGSAGSSTASYSVGGGGGGGGSSLLGAGGKGGKGGGGRNGSGQSGNGIDGIAGGGGGGVGGAGYYNSATLGGKGGDGLIIFYKGVQIK